MRTLKLSRDTDLEDLQTELTAKHVMRVFRFLASRLPPAERQKLIELADNGLAGDEPADFSGKPLVGGGQLPVRHGMDARRARRRMRTDQASYDAMFPDAERVRVLW